MEALIRELIVELMLIGREIAGIGDEVVYTAPAARPGENRKDHNERVRQHFKRVRMQRAAEAHADLQERLQP